MEEVRAYINHLRKDCQAKLEEMHAARKVHNKLETEVDQLRINTLLLRKRVIKMTEQARQAMQRRRVKEHLGGYVETLSHRRARIDINVQKMHEKNEALREERDGYTAEQLDLRKILAAICEHEKLNPPSNPIDGV